MGRGATRWQQYRQPKYDPTFSRELWNKREARQEFNRLRLLSNVQQKAMSMTREYGKRTKYEPIKPLPMTATDGQIRKALSDVARQLGSAKTSTSKRRSTEYQTLKTLGKHGYGFVNRSNLKQFGDFMQAARDHYGKRSYDSERVAQMFRYAKKSGIAPEKVQSAFDEYMKKGLDRRAIRER